MNASSFSLDRELPPQLPRQGLRRVRRTLCHARRAAAAAVPYVPPPPAPRVACASAVREGSRFELAYAFHHWVSRATLLLPPEHILLLTPLPPLRHHATPPHTTPTPRPHHPTPPRTARTPPHATPRHPTLPHRSHQHEPGMAGVRWHDTDLLILQSARTVVIAFRGTESAQDHMTNVQTFERATHRWVGRAV